MSLVMVKESDNFETEDSIDAMWLFGESVRTAIELANAEIKIYEMIEYVPGDVHSDFVDYCYKKRK